MNTLEPIYLANVILYIDTIETVVKLIQVNKKCQEATKILRYYNSRKLFDSDENDGFTNFVVVKNIFDIFPNIETIRCNQQFVKNNLELFEKVQQIELENVSAAQFGLPQQIKNKVIKIEIIPCPFQNPRISEFPNVRNLKIKYLGPNQLKSILDDKNVKLKQLTLVANYGEELNCLKEFKNIENISIFITGSFVSKEDYQKLKEFANVRTQYPIDGINMKDSIFPLERTVISDEYALNVLYDLSLFTKCQIIRSCDLRYFKLLEDIDLPFFNMQTLSIQIEGLNHLKKIGTISKLDCIPSSLTRLAFDPSFNFKELLERDKNCFANIKEVKFEMKWIATIGYSQLFSNFTSCTKVELGNGSKPNELFELPLHIREIVSNHFDDPNQMNEFAKVTGLKKLTLRFNDHKGVTKQQIQEMYDKLKELEWLTTNCFEGINYPSTLTYLDLEVKDDTDLSSYTNLKEVRIYCCFQNKTIKLPVKLHKLYIFGSGVISNSNEIEADRIILDSPSAQSLKWKSKNIFVKREFENPGAFMPQMNMF